MKISNTAYAVAPLTWVGVIIISVIIGFASNEVIGLAAGIIGNTLFIAFFMFRDPTDATGEGQQ